MNTNSKPIYILGISCFYHDSAAVLIKNGQLVAAAHEERFTRKKHDSSFPGNAIRYCLEEAGISIDDISYLGFYDKPLLKFERILQSFVNSWPSGYRAFIKAVPMWMREKLWIKQAIRKELKYNGPLYFAEHHMSHAASAFFVSPFNKAVILTVDGVGEWATASVGLGEGNKINLLKEIKYPHSLGLFYSIITYYLGFKPNSAEYKVMGLAPYGQPRFVNELKKLIKIYDDGSFVINDRVFKSYHELTGFEKALDKLFGFPKREADDSLEQHHKDLAASLQEVTNEIMIKIAACLFKEHGIENLCLAGGVALNCVANSKVLKHSGFKNIFIQPAAGDAGGALGIAYFIWNQVLGRERSFIFEHCFWGPEFSDETIKKYLEDNKIPFKQYSREGLLTKTAELIENQKVVGWFEGKMEWGPRALGARSILADARNKENWQRVNLKIKFRESFRPFAPSVLFDKASEWFDLETESPYMLFTAEVKKDSIPAVTHVDGSARLQTVSRSSNPLYYDLIAEFNKLTGCPVVINTSFNIRGEPIVCGPDDAFKTFTQTDMDFLIMGSFILDKTFMPKHLIRSVPIIDIHAD